MFPSYSASTNFLEARSTNEVTRFPCTCNVSVLVSSFRIFLTNKNDFVVTHVHSVEHQINLSDCSYPVIPLGSERNFESEVH